MKTYMISILFLLFIFSQINLSQNGEFLLDTSLVYWTPPAGSIDKDIAFDGTNYMVVWADFRNGSPFEADIYAARVNQNGDLLDYNNIAVCKGLGYQWEVSIAFDGTNYLVVWEDYRNNFTTGQDIYGARISPSGMVLDPDGFLIAGSSDKEQAPAVSFDGTNYLVVWDRITGARQNIYGARVSPSGTVLDNPGFQISNYTTYQWNPEVAFDGSGYLVVWEDKRNGNWDIYCTRVSPNAVVSNPPGIAISTETQDQQSISMYYGGGNFFITWNDLRNTAYPNYKIYGCRVDQAGSVLDPSGILISDSPVTDRNPSIAFDGTNYFVFWDRGIIGDPLGGIPDDFDIYGSRINQQGSVLDINGLLIKESPPGVISGYSGAVFGINDYFISFNESSPLAKIKGVKVSKTGALINPPGVDLRISVNHQSSPAVASDGVNYLAVWVDYRGINGYEIYGTRIGPNGNILDNAPIPIAVNGVDDMYLPDVAFNGTNYLVVWQEKNDIYGARVSPAGVVLDSDPIEIYKDNGFLQERPKVCSDGNGWLVIWQDGRPSAGLETDIYGARIDPDGSVLDPQGLLISSGADWQRDPVAAFDGQNYMIVWEDERNGLLDMGIYGTRMTTAGVVLDPDGIQIYDGESGMGQNPSITFNGSNYLVAWSTDDIQARRVSTNGTLLDPAEITICSEPGDQYFVKVAFDGENYLAVWEDYRNGDQSDIYGSYFDTNLNIILPFLLTDNHDNQQLPALCSADPGAIFVAFSAFTHEINGLAANIYRIWGIFSDEILDVDEGKLNQLNNFFLYQNYPNPFNPSTSIQYAIGSRQFVQLKVYDVLGNEIATLVNEEKAPGTYEVMFNSESSIRHPASGIYFYQLKAGDYLETKKMVLLR